MELNELYEAKISKYVDGVEEIIRTEYFVDIDETNNFCTYFNTSGTGWDSPRNYMRASWKRLK